MLELLSYIRESLLGEWHGPIASACRRVGAFVGPAPACATRARGGCLWLAAADQRRHREELIRDGWKDGFRLFIAAARPFSRNSDCKGTALDDRRGADAWCGGLATNGCFPPFCQIPAHGGERLLSALRVDEALRPAREPLQTR